MTRLGWVEENRQRQREMQVSPLRRRKVRESFGRDDKFEVGGELDLLEGWVEVAEVGVGGGHGLGILRGNGGGRANGGFAGGGD